MQITDNILANGLALNINNSLTNLNTITNEISSGKSLTLPSDNPAGTSQVLSLSEALISNAQYTADASTASSVLNASSSALSSVGNVLDTVNQIAIQGANTGAQSSQSLAALADQVDSSIQQITQLANTNVAGKYVFGGTQTQTAPYSGSPPVYNGNEEAMTATIGQNNTLTLNTPGSNGALFTDTLSVLQTLKTDLLTGNSSAISADITSVQSRITATSQANAVLGTKINEVTAAQQTLQQTATQYQTAQSNLQSTDLATAYVQLQTSQNVYQASLEAVSNAFKYTLADYVN